jgi:hypothetical protein
LDWPEIRLASRYVALDSGQTFHVLHTGHGHGKATYHTPGLDGQEAGTVDEIIVSDLHNIVKRLRQNRMLLGFLPWV